MDASRTARAFVLPLCLIAASLCPVQGQSRAAQILELYGLKTGICSMPYAKSVELAEELARSSTLRIHLQNPSFENVIRMRAALAQAKLLGTRVYVDEGSARSNAFADNFVDLIVVDRGEDVPSADIHALTSEAFRVLRPGGVALIGSRRGAGKWLEELKSQFGGGRTISAAGCTWYSSIKPQARGIDHWGAWSRDASNNLMSRDVTIRPPYQTKWMELPYYLATPTVTLEAGGRLFALGGSEGKVDFAHTRHTVYARNAFNGTLLWSSNKLIDSVSSRSPSALVVATADHLYVAHGRDILKVNAATGAQETAFTVAGLRGPVNWIGIAGTTLFALDTCTSGTSIAAYDLHSSTSTWAATETGQVAGRMVGILDTNVVYCIGDTALVCRDTRTGAMRWRCADPVLKGPVGLFKAAFWRSMGNSPVIVMTPHSVFFRSPTIKKIFVISLHGGAVLASHDARMGNITAVWGPQDSLADAVVVRDDTGRGVRLSMRTGAVVDTNALRPQPIRCDRWLYTANEVIIRGDDLNSFRADCGDGLIPANGHIYCATPGKCRCGYPVCGIIAIEPAAADKDMFDSASRRTLPGPKAHRILSATSDSADWPVYRANIHHTGSSRATLSRTMTRRWLTEPGDRATAPIAVGSRFFVGRGNGVVECRDAASGAPVWSFATGGAVNASPAFADGRIYVGSSDGFVYCLDAREGALLWRYSPSIGNRRLINLYGSTSSTWPVNTGVLVDSGIAYGVAGFWQRDGFCAFALNSRTGEPVWETHRGVQPELSADTAIWAAGQITLSGDQLLLCSARSFRWPARFSRKTGELVPVAASSRMTFGRPCRGIGIVYGYEMLSGRQLFSPEGDLYLKGWEAMNPRTLYFSRPRPGGGRVFVTPFSLTTIAPAWDDSMFVSATHNDGTIYGWTRQGLIDRLEYAIAGKDTMYYVSDELGGKSPEDTLGGGDVMVAVSDLVYNNSGIPVPFAGAQWGPVYGQTLACALGANAAVACMSNKMQSCDNSLGKIADTIPADTVRPWFLRTFDRATGAIIGEYSLPGMPRIDCICITRTGLVIVVLHNGAIVCQG